MNKYLIKRIQERIKIQGATESVIWDKADVLSHFSFPWDNEEAPRTEFRALYNEDYFYFRFDVEDENVLSFVDTNHKLEVVDSDRVEIFFRTDEKMNPYYCLEMDARGRVLDYRAKKYREFDFEWQWPGQLNIKASENERGYVVEGAISLNSLEELGVLKNKKIEAGLYRGYCLELPQDKKEAKLQWISWINPNTPKPDFHVPSSFGGLYLEEKEHDCHCQ